MQSSSEEQETQENQPVFNLPMIIPVVIGLIALLHALRVYVFDNELNYQTILGFSFIPARYSDEAIAAIYPLSQYWTPVSYAFLHADWTHLFMNSFWLLAFGGVTARRLEAIRFMVLFVVGALFGAALHYVFHANDISPMIGASASVSACMGAALRLPYFSEARFKGDIRQIQIRSVIQALTNRQALTFIIIWFGVNLLFGTGVVDITGNGNPIAWEAHIGGFVSGLLLFGLIDRLGR
jgi:membrane associated rhomboid family serine protease